MLVMMIDKDAMIHGKGQSEVLITVFVVECGLRKMGF